MFGLALVFLSAIFGEVGSSIGKQEVEAKKESIYSLGFLNILWGTALFFAYALTQSGSFVFDLASLPTFGLRFVFDIVVAYCGVHALARADRSTFGFLHSITIPLLLLADLSFGYTFSVFQVLGMCVIVAGFVILFAKHGIRGQGIGYVLVGSIASVVTISLYKYDISHFNSVPAEQGMMSLLIMLFYFIMARWSGENPFALLRQPKIFVQSFSSGVAQMFFSFAYLFAPASVITSASRSFSLFTAVISGNHYFHEGRLGIKLVGFCVMTVGIILLAF